MTMILALGVEAAKTRCRRHPSRDAPNDHDVRRRLRGLWSFRHHHLMSSSARAEPGLVFGGLRVRRVCGLAMATLGWRYVTEHLLDVGTASLPGWLATVPTCNGSTHTPQGIREKHKFAELEDPGTRQAEFGPSGVPGPAAQASFMNIFCTASMG